LILSYSSFTKVNPPLREESDRLAIIEGLKDGTIDAIATDHAPHHLDEKRVEYALAANGISGIETAFSLAYTYLVKPGYIDMKRLIELMSLKPSELLGLKAGLLEGNPADITVVDLNRSLRRKHVLISLRVLFCFYPQIVSYIHTYPQSFSYSPNGWKVYNFLMKAALRSKILNNKPDRPS
jgi:dihydroorotase-like cyclic amidohydrolase